MIVFVSSPHRFRWIQQLALFSRRSSFGLKIGQILLGLHHLSQLSGHFLLIFFRRRRINLNHSRNEWKFGENEASSTYFFHLEFDLVVSPFSLNFRIFDAMMLLSRNFPTHIHRKRQIWRKQKYTSGNWLLIFQPFEVSVLLSTCLFGFGVYFVGLSSVANSILSEPDEF